MRRSNNSLMRAVRSEGLDRCEYLGHGVFSVVYATGPDTVAKLTVDPRVVQFYEEARFHLDNPLLPKIHNIQMLEQTVRDFKGHDLTLYRIDCERLLPVKRKKGCAAYLNSCRFRRGFFKFWSLWAKRFVQWCPEKKEWASAPRDTVDELIAQNIGTAREFVTDAIDLMLSVVWCGGSVDLDGGNFMKRPNGELVINDPVCCDDERIRGGLQRSQGR